MKKLHFFRLLVCGVALASAQLLADSGQIFRSQSGQFLVRQVSQFSSLVQIDLLARAPAAVTFSIPEEEAKGAELAFELALGTVTKSYRLSDGDVSDRVSFKGRWVKIQSVQNESNLDVRVGIEDTNDTAKEVWLINFKSKTKLTDVLIDGESGARVTQIYFERPQPTHELVGRVKFGDKCLGRAYLVESDQRQACIVSEPLGSPIDFSALGSQLVRLRGYYSSGVFIAQGAILER